MSFDLYSQLFKSRYSRNVLLSVFVVLLGAGTAIGIQTSNPWLPIILIVGSMATIFASLAFFGYLQQERSVGSPRLYARIESLEKASDERAKEINSALAKLNLDDPKRSLIAELTKQVLDEGKEQVLDGIRNSLIANDRNQEISDSIIAVEGRLEAEVNALRKGANVNLFIGILFALAGIGLLWSVAYEKKDELTTGALLAMLPRVSLALLAEFTAFFFLGLYKAAAGEIRFYHNEASTLTAKFVALRLARLHQDAKALDAMLKELMKVERNFILSKGQTTVHLEHQRLDSAKENAHLKTLEKLASQAINLAGAHRRPAAEGTKSKEEAEI